MSLMQAVICTKYGPPEVLVLKEVVKPVPASGEVLIKVSATGVTTSDTIIRGFKVPIGFRLPMSIAIGFSKPRRPILGMVLSGEVVEIGSEVSRFKVGDQVFSFNIRRFGCYAEYNCLSENDVIASKPRNLSFGEAAALPYGGMIALHYLKKAGFQGRQKILIFGASGAVGTAAIQFARDAGAGVTGVCSSANFELVKSLGASEVIDYRKEDFTRRAERYDFIFDAVGKRKSREYLSKEKAAKVLMPYGIYLSVDDGSPKLLVENLVLIKEMAESNRIKPVIDRQYHLSEIAEAHRYVDQGHKKGNVVITVP